MSRLSLLKTLLLSFLLFITFNLFSYNAYAFTGGGKFSHYNGYITSSGSSIPDYDSYKYFYDCISTSPSSLYSFELEKLQRQDGMARYQIDFPAGTFFNKFQIIAGNKMINYSLNYVADSAVINQGSIQSVSYYNNSNADDTSDGRVSLVIDVGPDANGLLIFCFKNEDGSYYEGKPPCSIEEQTVSQAFKELNGYDYGGEPPKEEPPKDEPSKDEPLIKPPEGGLDSLPIDSTSTDTVIESIIEGLKTFFSWLLKFLVPIILGAVALGVIVKGSKWLWCKAKSWVSSS